MEMKSDCCYISKTAYGTIRVYIPKGFQYNETYKHQTDLLNRLSMWGGTDGDSRNHDSWEIVDLYWNCAPLLFKAMFNGGKIQQIETSCYEVKFPDLYNYDDQT